MSTVTLANLRKMVMAKQWTRADGMGVKKGLRQGPYLFLIPEHVNRTIEFTLSYDETGSHRDFSVIGGIWLGINYGSIVCR
jgi:hypothetical protein